MNAAILIGGRARRLQGRFKPTLPIEGRSILERQIDAIRAAGIDGIALIGSWRSDHRPPLPVFADAVAGAGALGGLYTALLVASGDAALVLAGDMPFVDGRLLARLLALESGADAVIARTASGSHPLCGCYRRSVALALKARIDRGELRIRAAVAALQTRTLTMGDAAAVGAEDIMLTNVNTGADYQRACERARDCH